MPLWGSNDQANNLPKFAADRFSAGSGSVAKAANNLALYNNTTAGVFVNGETDSVVFVTAEQIFNGLSVPGGPGWYVKRQGTGGRAGRTHYETMVSFTGNGMLVHPVGFNWPFATYPLSIQQTSSTSFVTNFIAELYAAAALAGPTYYVNGSTGSDAAAGTALGTAVKSIWKATQLGNAGGVPFNVRVAAIAGGYPRENGFSNSSTPVPNTVAAAYISTGGVVECWTGSTLTWTGTPDATYTNTYVAARSSVSQIIDTAVRDANGDYLRMVQVADAATCNTTPNSWAQVAGNIYVHRQNNDVVSNANTRVLLKATPNIVIDGTSKSIYLNGFELHGGANACVAMGAQATMNVIAVNVKTCYAGDNLVNINGWKIDYITGLVALVNCVSSQNEADGFNTHWTPGGTPQVYTLTIGCRGYNNGRDTVLSCNGLTSHDGCINIDVMGEYFNNYGTNVEPINSNQMWCVGTYAHDSFGDTSHGGTSPPRDFEAQSTAQMWLQGCRSSGSAQALNASGTAFIKTRGFLIGNGQAVVGANANLPF